MGNVELAPEVDVSALEPLLSPDVVSELLDTYMSTLTVSGQCVVPSQAVSRARAAVWSQPMLCPARRQLCGPDPGCVLYVDGSVLSQALSCTQTAILAL